MPTYVIDADRGLWRIARNGDEDFNTIGVERPKCAHCGHQPTARLALDEVVVDPTDQELAELEPAELARFGMMRQKLFGI